MTTNIAERVFFRHILGLGVNFDYLMDNVAGQAQALCMSPESPGCL